MKHSTEISYKSTLTQLKKLEKLWDAEQNNTLSLSLTDAIIHPTIRVHWICSKEHRWTAPLSEQFERGLSCPRCSKYKRLSLTSKFPEVANYWHPTKNDFLQPSQVFPHSEQKVWWQCEKGHEWQEKISKQSRRQQACPYCANREVLVGFNDLATTHPQLIPLIDQKANEGLDVTMLMAQKKTKIWWRCEHGHLSKYPLDYFIRKQPTCPTCQLKREPLSQTCPDLAKQWHPTLNGELTPDDVSGRETTMIWWLGECGHEWKTQLRTRFDKRAFAHVCPICSRNEKRLTRLQEQVEAIGSLQDTHPHLAAQWHPTLNGSLTPNQVTANLTQKVWWVSQCGHEWECQINSRVRFEHSIELCPTCQKQANREKAGTLATLYPELAEEWHPTKNGDLTPDQVTKGSNKKVWWLGDCGHEWEARVATRVRGKGCHTCRIQALNEQNRLKTQTQN